MMKYVLGFLLVFGLAVYVAIKDEHAPHQPAQEAKQASTSTVAAVPDANHPHQNIDNPERNLPSWYGFFRWPNGTTTWAILLTLLALAEQTRLLRDYVVATKQMAVSTLRPRLVIRGIEFVPGGDWAVPGAAPWHIRMFIANSGGSIAKITESNLTFAHEKDFMDGLNISLPTFPRYGGNALSFGIFSLQAGGYTNRDISLSDEMSTTFGFRQTAKTNNINIARTIMFWWGFLRYEDIDGVNRTTGFGFRYDVNSSRFSRMDEPEYNYTD